MEAGGMNSSRTPDSASLCSGHQDDARGFCISIACMQFKKVEKLVKKNSYFILYGVCKFKTTYLRFPMFHRIILTKCSEIGFDYFLLLKYSLSWIFKLKNRREINPLNLILPFICIQSSVLFIREFGTRHYSQSKW